MVNEVSREIKAAKLDAMMCLARAGKHDRMIQCLLRMEALCLQDNARSSGRVTLRSPDARGKRVGSYLVGKGLERRRSHKM